jgi:hypothetical protein
MALKTTNYEIKEMGITLPEVVALVEVDTEINTATFKIGINRQAILDGKVVETRKMEVPFNRNENPYITAYNYAKGSYTIEENGEIYEVKGILYGWKDDYEE